MTIQITMPESYIDFDRMEYDDIKHRLNLEPFRAGVYVLYDINDFVMYVGKSKNLQRRLREHFVGKDIMRDYYRDISRVRVYFVNDPLEREIYETFMINTLKPYINSSKVYHDDMTIMIEEEIQELDEKIRELQEEKEELLGDNEDEETDADVETEPEIELGDELLKIERLKRLNEEIRKLNAKRASLKARI